MSTNDEIKTEEATSFSRSEELNIFFTTDSTCLEEIKTESFEEETTDPLKIHIPQEVRNFFVNFFTIKSVFENG